MFTSDFSPYRGGVGLGKGVGTTQIFRGAPGEGTAGGCGAKTSGDIIIMGKRGGRRSEKVYLVRMGKNSEGGVKGALNFVSGCGGH